MVVPDIEGGRTVFSGHAIQRDSTFMTPQSSLSYTQSEYNFDVLNWPLQGLDRLRKKRNRRKKIATKKREHNIDLKASARILKREQVKFLNLVSFKLCFWSHFLSYSVVRGSLPGTKKMKHTWTGLLPTPQGGSSSSDEDVSQTFPITCFGTLKNLKESGFVPPNTGCTNSKITEIT